MAPRLEYLLIEEELSQRETQDLASVILFWPSVGAGDFLTGRMQSWQSSGRSSARSARSW
jgi:hypothetical protein